MDIHRPSDEKARLEYMEGEMHALQTILSYVLCHMSTQDRNDVLEGTSKQLAKTVTIQDNPHDRGQRHAFSEILKHIGIFRDGRANAYDKWRIEKPE